MAENGTTLFVGNLPFRASPEELNELFSQAGSVVSVHIPTDRETGRSRGFGFVEMDVSNEMEQAISMFNGYSLDGRALVVNQARAREERR
jgi:RNA recognition motif-containing protein